MEVHKLLQAETFGPPDPATLRAYEEKCSRLFPLATIFRPSPSSETTPSKGGGMVPVKEVVPKNISASGGGVVILKETALSSAAMSDLSGDINDTAREGGDAFAAKT